MTLIEHNLSPPTAARLAHRVQVQWTAMRHESDSSRCGAFCRSTAILVIEVLDEHRAMMELWVEECGRRRTIHERTLVKARTSISAGLVQIDAEGLCRITVKVDPGDAQPLFAQCSLLAAEGFVAGGFDPPAATVKSLGQVAASA